MLPDKPWAWCTPIILTLTGVFRDSQTIFRSSVAGDFYHVGFGSVHQQGVSQAIPQKKSVLRNHQTVGTALTFFWDNNGVLLFVNLNIESFRKTVNRTVDFS